MQLKELVTEDRAVSPVIGVILMVAITVILAAVIGTFVLGLGDSVQQTSPNANFAFDFGDTDVTITHEGGDSIDKERLTVTGADLVSDWPDDTVTAGDSFTGDNYSDDANIRVVWESEDGSTSATLANRQVP